MENPLTAEEKAEEQEHRRNDSELHTLIKSSRLLEQFAADQLDGADRRRHQRDQLVSMGIQVDISQSGSNSIGILGYPLVIELIHCLFFLFTEKGQAEGSIPDEHGHDGQATRERCQGIGRGAFTGMPKVRFDYYFYL